MAEYDPELSVREARARYFEASGFPQDGGYAERWVKLRLGPIPFWFPNSNARRRAVRLHDIHHVLTGYDTDWKGEAEIGAWEIASGCADYYAAWVLNLSAMLIGWGADLGATLRAFARGRCSKNLYVLHASPDGKLLCSSVGALRAGLRLDRAPGAVTLRDRISFGLWSCVSLAYALMWIALLLAPLIGIAVLVLRCGGAIEGL